MSDNLYIHESTVIDQNLNVGCSFESDSLFNREPVYPKLFQA